MAVQDPRFSPRSFNWKDDLKRGSKEADRREYQVAIWTAGLCALINITVMSMSSGASDMLAMGVTGAMASLIYAVKLLIGTISAFVAVMVVCALMKEEAGPLTLCLLRLAAVIAGADLVLFVLPSFGCFTLVLYVSALVFMFMFLFDYERVTSLLAAFLTVGVNYAIVVGLGLLLG